MNFFDKNDHFPEWKKTIGWALLSGLTLLSSVVAAQENIDSLRQILRAARGEQRTDALFNLGLELQFYSSDSLLLYAEKIKYTPPTPRTEGYYHELMGTYHGHTRQLEKSIEHFKKSAAAYAQTNLADRRLQVLHNLTFLFNTLNRFGESLEIQHQAIELGMIQKDTVRVIEMLHQHCIVQTRQNLFHDAIKSTTRAYALESQMGRSHYYTYAGLARVYENWPGKLDSAFIYFEKALHIAKAQKNLRQTAIEENNLARCYVRSKQYAQALTHAQSAVSYLRDKPVEKPNLGKTYLILADAELGLRHPDKALEYVEQARQLSTSGEDYLSQASVHRIRSEIFAQKGDFQRAYEESVAWKTASDSVTLRQRAGLVADITAQYQTREQQATIAEQTLHLERTLARNRLLIAGSLLLLLFGGIVTFGLRQKRRQAELELRLRAAETDRLRTLDHVKSAFFTNISHEFRTPLTLIISPLRDLIADRFKGDAKRSYVLMERNATRLLSLVNQLLDLSKLESGKLTLHPAPSNLAAHLRAICAAFETMADQKQIAFQADIPNAPAWYQYDHDKMEKIIVNLLSNAFKFTREEGTVALQMTVQPDRVHITVSDTGIGIPADQIGRIFERFYQVENPEAEGLTGSGIGLALAKELVLLMGGQIEAHSMENKGTRFALQLPLVAAKPQAQPRVPDNRTAILAENPAPSPEHPAHARKNHLRASILLIEDNEDIRAYLREQLQDSYQILEAANGQSGLDLALEEIPDLIITDLMMPVMDGLAMTERLKKDLRTSHIPIIMLTAKAERDDRLTGLKIGAEAYLTKPLDMEELGITMTNLLQQRTTLYEKYSHSVRLGISELPEALSLDQQWLREVLAAIEANMDDEFFGVAELAEKMAMSRSNLFRKLNALSGKNPNALLRELRLARAKQLLERGAGNVSEIAFMVGFNSRTYFAKCFAEQYGVAPSEVG